MALITVAETETTLTNYQGAVAPRLAIFANKTVVADGGDVIIGGSPQTGRFCKIIACTLTGGVITVPLFTLLSTTDSSDPTVQLTAWFINGSNEIIAQFLNAFYVYPDDLTTNWEDLMTLAAGGLPEELVRNVRINRDLYVVHDIGAGHSITAVEGFHGITNENVPTALSEKNISDSTLVNSEIDNPTVDGGTFDGPEINDPVIARPTFAADTPFVTGPITASGPIIAPSIEADISGCTGLPGTPSGPAFESLSGDASTWARYQADDGGVGTFDVFRKTTSPESVFHADALGRLDLKGGLIPYTKGGLPAAGKPGRLAIVTDNIRGKWRDTGSIWIKEYGGVVNVMDGFGVVADGVTDDTAALQDAADAAPGMYLYFPSNADVTVYLFGALEIPAGVRIKCDPGVTLKLKPSASTSIRLPLFDVRGIDVSFLHLWMDGNRSNQSGSTPSDSFDNGGGGRAWRALIKADGSLYTINRLKVIDCDFRNGYGAGITTQEVDDISILNNRASDLNYEFAFCGVGNKGRINDNTIENIGFGGVGVTLGPTGNAINAAGYDHLDVLNNFIRNIDRDGVKIDLGGTHVAVKNNKMYQTGMVAEGYGTDYPAVGLVSNNPLEHVQVTDNIIDDCAQGINLQVGEGGVYDVAIEDNQIDAVRGPTQGYGLAVVFNDVTYTASKVAIQNNKVYNFELYGLHVTGGDDMTVFDNKFIGDGVASQRGMHFQLSRAMANLTIEKNLVKGCVNVGAQGVNFFGKVADGLTYTNLQFLRNRIYSGASGNIGVRADLDNSAALSDDFIVSGLFDGNYVDGKVQTTAPAVQYGRNRVTGLYSVDGASAILSVVSQPQMLGASATADFFGATAAHSCEDSATTITVNGAAEGDIVHVAGPASLFAVAGSQITAYVSAANTVKVRRCNYTASALSNPGSVTLNVRVEKV